MIPSRTVFNHRKWIYIELAITRAHSGHGPLVYQPPSAYERVEPAPMFSPFHPSMPCQPSSLLAFPTEMPSFRSRCYSSSRFDLSSTTSRSFIIYYFSSRPIYLPLLPFSFPLLFSLLPYFLESRER